MRFLRSHTNIDLIVKALKPIGYHGLATVMKKVQIPTFAEWRWGKVKLITISFNSFWTSLAAVFKPTWFGKLRDLTDLKRLTAALKSDKWHQQLFVVSYVSLWLTDIQEWIGGCDCADNTDSDGSDQPHECNRSGRRLASAYDFANASLQDGLDEANKWTAAAVGGYTTLFAEATGAVRSAHQLGHVKIKHLGVIPYLLARLLEPGMNKYAFNNTTQWHVRICTTVFPSSSWALNR